MNLYTASNIRIYELISDTVQLSNQFWKHLFDIINEFKFYRVDDHDGDASNKLTSGTLTVIILNENDNFPTFNLEFITVEVMEKQTEGW